MYYTFTHADLSVTLAIIIMCTALAVTIILAVTITVVIILKRFIHRKDDTALHTSVTDNNQIEEGNTLGDTSTVNLPPSSLPSPPPPRHVKKKVLSIGNTLITFYL